MPKLGYNNEEGKLGLSYSKLQVLHSCPRLFQITQLNNHRRQIKNIIFAYGHAVGAGVQALVAGKSLQRAVLEALSQYDAPDLWEVHKSGRSIDSVITAITKFHQADLLNGWIVPQFRNHKGDVVSGIEFFYQINVDAETTYQGHIDAILYNPEENIFLVLELKTTGRYKEETYKNSQQTLGYSLIVDWIVDHSSGLLEIRDAAFAKANNKVLYLVFDIAQELWQPLPLLQTSLAKADFLQGLLLDCGYIKSQIEADYFVKNGDSCSKFNRPCELYNLCDQRSLTKVKAAPSDDGQYVQEEPALILELGDLLQQQMNKVESDAYDSSDPIAIPNIVIHDDDDFSL